MASISINSKDKIVMSLVHYFVTNENYSPIIVQGTKDEIWLENLEAPYKIIRINTSYIHNNEQYEFDILKVKHVIKQIKKKTLSLKFNVLNICLDVAERVSIEDFKGINTINAANIKDIRENENLKKIFPNISQKMIKQNNSMDLLFNVTNDINNKTEKDNQVYEETFKPKPIIFTKIIIAICFLMFFLTYIFGHGSEDINTLLAFGANYAPLVKSGEIWRILTSAFLHAGIFHLIINMYALHILGSQVENFVGKWNFLSIYLISAISGSLMSILFSDFVSVGASGAIFGLSGALLYFGYHYRLYLNDVLKTQILPIILINLIIGFMIPAIDISAHIGGLIGGYLAAAAFGIKGKTDKKEKNNSLVALLIYLIFLIVMLFK